MWKTLRFSMEVRDNNNEKINLYMDKCIEAVRAAAASRNVQCQITEHSKAAPMHLTDRIVNSMEIRAKEQGLNNYKIMNSGAVHDACMLAYTVATGMIFVPSINGRSHVPEENTNEADLIFCAQFLMDTILSEFYPLNCTYDIYMKRIANG